MQRVWQQFEVSRCQMLSHQESRDFSPPASQPDYRATARGQHIGFDLSKVARGRRKSLDFAERVTEDQACTRSAVALSAYQEP